MPSLLWPLKLFAKIFETTVKVGSGILRSFLRGVVSVATRMEESLPDIKETMEEIDPGKTYAEWALQYRSSIKATEMEKTLALWDKQKKLDTSVMVEQTHRRARKYRYVFSGLINDNRTGDAGYKMFSMYSDELLSPNEIMDIFNNEYFNYDYENKVKLIDIIMKRVQVWPTKK